MFTSAKTLKRHLSGNLGGTVFLALFGAVYELFSHEVYSYWMIYAFAVPLVMGVVPYTILLIRERIPSDLFLRLWSSAIAVLSTGCIFMGVLVIYGTTNQKVIAYPVAGGLLLFAALFSLLSRQEEEKKEDGRITGWRP